MIHVYGVFEERDYWPCLQSLWWIEGEALSAARKHVAEHPKEFQEIPVTQEGPAPNVAAWQHESSYFDDTARHYRQDKRTIFVRKIPVYGSVLSALGAMADSEEKPVSPGE